MKFDRFVAVDWSGAEKGGKICMAECLPGSEAPSLVPPETRTRPEMFHWIVSKVNKAKSKILVGLDFAFAFPYCDEGSYFPKHPHSPNGTECLWSLINNICRGSPDFYGGPFYRSESAPFREYLWYPKNRGDQYRNRFRLTEKACMKVTTPTSVFKLLGANQVGSGSVAGMRFLHALAGLRREDKIAIWPFDSNLIAPLTIVEIFPRFYQKVGFQIRDMLNDKLSEHERDALISAIALRDLSVDKLTWHPKAMHGCATKYEGWIFGVT